jgi:hypothetical protein
MTHTTHPDGEGQPAPEQQASLRSDTIGYPHTTLYEYLDGTGALVAIKERSDGPGSKEICWRRPDGTAGLGGLPMSDLPLYGLPELLATAPDEPVLIVEGEKACDAARRLGLTAVSLAGGAGQTDFGSALEALRGRKVILWADKDTQGREFMCRVAAALAGIAADVRWLKVPGLPPQGDAADFAATRTAAELRPLMDAAQPFLSRPDLGDGAGRKRNQPSEEAAVRWVAKPLSELSSKSLAIEWVWDGFLPLRSVSLLTGLWKAGKTTLLAHLLDALAGADADFLGQTVRRARILLVTEESEALWAMRRDALDLGDHVQVISRPFMTRPDTKTWQAFLSHVANLVHWHGYTLVVFDALPNLWPVRDENAAPDVLNALTPLNAITAADTAVLLLAHPRKGDAAEGQATRGSGAIAGFVDIIVELRRFDPERRDDTRRTLTTYRRFDETPAELVIEYHPDAGYRPVGTRAEAKTSDRLTVVVGLLGGPPGTTVDDLLQDWPHDSDIARPGERTLRRDLDAAFQQGRVGRSGTGRRNDPHRYYLPQSQDSFPASSTPMGEPVMNPSGGNGPDDRPEQSAT